MNSTGSSGRSIVLAYGAVCYAAFLGTFVYFMGFIGNLFVPVTLDAPRTTGFVHALLTDLGLVALFALQHSVMARPAFKRWITQVIPAAAERSTYVLASSLALIALMALWEPLGGMVWQLDHPLARVIAWGVFGGGILLILASTFLINHFDLFGLRQVWLHMRARPYAPLQFSMPWLYGQVRHPL